MAVLSPWTAVHAKDYTYPPPPDIASEAAILMEAETGQVLYGKSERKRMEPASLTKIMTCLLAAELWDGSEEPITITQEMLYGIDEESSTMDLVPEESLPMPDLLCGLMLPSANDAANAIAVTLGGSIDGFVDDMNARAAELGLTGTHFENPHGLPSDNHYSTAYDLAALTREAVQNETFMRFAGAAEHDIPATPLSEERHMDHTNRTLCPDHEWYYSDAIAGKTGWTRRAGHCLMTAARRDGMTLICVVMRAGSQENEYKDTTALLDYGFEQFKRASIDCTPYDNTQITLQGEKGEPRRAVLSLRERKFTAVVPRDAQGDMMVFSLPNGESITDGDYADALLSWSDQVSGAPKEPIRKVQVRVWVEEVREASAPAQAEVTEPSQEPEDQGKLGIALGGIGGMLILTSTIQLFRKKKG
ncbi:MAG: D-alanyl-D-alanine carboxypeptidase [Oscillospiraceae bacterium]|jgi:D-alanyl-D-alanine carboxypeptidase|nr:D-alanyl-D-alanine carboxypeptidase [Oscillospiraceae bacterium]